MTVYLQNSGQKIFRNIFPVRIYTVWMKIFITKGSISNITLRRLMFGSWTAKIVFVYQSYKGSTMPLGMVSDNWKCSEIPSLDIWTLFGRRSQLATPVTNKACQVIIGKELEGRCLAPPIPALLPSIPTWRGGWVGWLRGYDHLSLKISCKLWLFSSLHWWSFKSSFTLIGHHV